MKFDWNRARAFLVTAEEGSLSAAARALGMAQPTLGRQVEALQEELGVVLFERTGRGLELTPSGLDLLEHVRTMGEAAGRFSLGASGRAQALEGTIAVSASEIDAAYLLPPVIAKLRRAAAGLTVDLIAKNTASDLRRREADIALRNFRPDQPELIARKMSDVTARLYASELYLERFEKPLTPHTLADADFISLWSPETYLGALAGAGLSVERGNLTILSDSHLVHWELLKAGGGIGMVPEFLGDSTPGVCRVLEGSYTPFIFPLWLTTHRELNTSRRVRMVFDFLAEALSAH
ncbi:LysR family transcriptional regulator [Devosia limi]|uniref:Transcriptional regulator, LysR family n=1 Tax=Devosia limi DSM 17137 TaxID=1121477 RepID=A0A1M5FSA5_9HYPH|nr:LysR family transcriptional regulator [Devosia limi]SHF94299.1 transcriptional regulator, LysR family [Devosia limi DSM 17137]